jgi:hypothetical protein
MATRTIVTSHPDVPCDVCERRLLRGEQPDVFLVAGERRTVCELCAPRATHEGWLRETDRNSLTLSPLRPRRGRNFFERLRQVGKPAAGSAKSVAPSTPLDEGPGPFDFLDASASASEVHQQSGLAAAESHDARAVLPTGDGRAERAVDVFNAGEHPRRIAGVARSLGVPGVSVRPDQDLGNLVSIVIAWELCWYRYRVDLDEDVPEATVLSQGTELDELAREDRDENAVADELGSLFMSGV